MKTAILTGGTGFLGFWLLNELVKNDIFVYVIVRKNSKRLHRLNNISGIKIVVLDMDNIIDLNKYVKEADTFYHLAWEGERNNFNSQMKNINQSVDAMKAASTIGVKQFIMTGSQAEYGIYNREVDENSPTNPVTAYGACKVATFNILKTLSEQLGIGLTWVRVFSVYGEGDNPNTLISYLFKCFNEERIPELTDGSQLWDFLYAEDAANALCLFGDKEKLGLYNLAYGESKPLKEYIIKIRDLVKPESKLNFSSDSSEQSIELRANIDLIKNEIQWKPKKSFTDGILKMKNKQFY